MARHHSVTLLLRSFAGRIVVGGALIHTLLIPFLFGGVLYIVEKSYEEQFVNNVRHDIHQLAEYFTETRSNEHILFHLEDILLSGRAVYARMALDNDLEIFPPSNHALASEAFTEDFYFGDHDDSVYYISLPLTFEHSGTSAVLQMGYDESGTQDLIQRTYERGLILAIAYVVLSLILVGVISPQLTRSLQRLRDAAQKIAGGRTGEGLQVRSNITEIADLADDLERMRVELVSNGQAIAAREARIRAIMDNVVDGIVTINGRGDIESLNRAAERIFGYHAVEVVGKSLNTLLAQPYFCEYDQREARHDDKGQRITSMADQETVGQRSDGHAFPMEMAISELRLGQKEGTLHIAIVRDITERKQYEAELKALQEDLERRVIKRTRELATLNRELEHQALHDALTELPNRLLLQDRLRQSILTAQRKNQPMALLITDLDRFKEINDTLGHHYGDLVLQQVAARMRNSLRESDTIARLGGDEFAVLLPSINGETDAVNTARKIISALEEPILLEEQSFHIGASVGIALFPDHGRDSPTLMRHADVAMYIAKRAAENYAIYNTEKDQHSVSRLALVGELRHAIEFKQLVLFYQPKIDLKLGRISGVEALLRWDHPQRGLVSPDEFIPLAEHTGLIRPLTFFVLDEALHQLHLWQKVGLNLTLAVNLSAKHLQDQQLADKISTLMEEWSVPPEQLEFEITESAIMADPLRAMDTLNQLDTMGVGLAIDDFGTGYSSLIYLKQLPVDEIKIDKSFIIDMLDNNEDLVIVRSTIDLAHNMGRRVVAEGVENERVLNKLMELGCDLAQGYYISRPVTAHVLTRWLKESEWHQKPPHAGLSTG